MTSNTRLEVPTGFSSNLLSFKLVLVAFGFLQRPITSVSQLSKNVKKNVGICSCATLVTGVNKHMINKN